MRRSSAAKYWDYDCLISSALKNRGQNLAVSLWPVLYSLYPWPRDHVTTKPVLHLLASYMPLRHCPKTVWTLFASVNQPSWPYWFKSSLEDMLRDFLRNETIFGCVSAELRAATQVGGLINSGNEDMSDPGGYRAWSIEVLC